MKIKDKRYDYHITVSAHLLIEKDKKLLLARRPETWEWAPGRWVLIGGKLYSDEAFTDVIKRKTKQELDFELLPKTLYQVKQLIMEEKQAFMYFFTTDYNGQRPSGEVEEYKWFSVDEIEKTPINEFAEYYYKDLLKEFLLDETEGFPTSKVESLNYVELKDEKTFKEWFEGAVNKNYDPEKLADYRSWEEKKK